ncbi:MAG: thioredoxin domain-containing protein [Planctomycetes bacterium]|nr:thioredoxin domain-containing protein [Planctomycetota bacterium]
MTPQEVTTDTGAPLPRAFFATGIVLLATAVVASLALVQQHFGGLEVPGCGPGSPCAKAAASVWGRVPWVDWPVSFVGLAYFLALLMAWLTSRQGVSNGFRQLVRFGAVISVGFVVVMLAGGYLCPYCLGAHAANLVFLLMVEMAPRPAAPSLRPLAIGGVVFLLATAALAVAEVTQKQRILEKEEGELARSTEQVIQRRPQDGGGASTQPQQDGPTFTGRYRLGPEAAPIRLVIFSDYQCEDCGHIEDDIFAFFAQRDDMSISVKHYPMSTDCNAYIGTNLHPNACWAARAAEAAGIIRGNDGFWQMHEWLFEHEGFFSNQQMRDVVIEQGYNFDQWTRVMAGEETLRLVQQDIDEGFDLGVQHTPMIFINGVELKGWRVQGGVQQAVEALAATNPPALTAAADQPKTAAETARETWQARAPATLPLDAQSWPLGTQDPTVHIMLWGDYQEPRTVQADAIIRNFMAGRSDVRYHFRHFPIDEACNPVVSTTQYPFACLAAKAAEAAGILGGVEGYWKIHAWLMENQPGIDEQKLDDAISVLGFDPQAFRAAMDSIDAAEAIAADATIAQSSGLRAVPAIFVNDRFVGRWRFAKTEALSGILQAASGE